LSLGVTAPKLFKETFMKKALQAVVVGIVLASGVSVVRADDPIKVAPDMYTLVFENPRVRVMQVVFKPGQSIKKHSHPDHYVYVLSGGQLEISKDEGKNVADLTTGQVIWIPAETHWAKNVGSTEIKLLVNELKSTKK
jgi:beta-alanine degradation protein BauB